MASANSNNPTDTPESSEKSEHNGTGKSPKRSALSSKRKTKNTILNYFKRSPSKKSHKMENAEKRKKEEAESNGKETAQPEKVEAAVAEVEKAEDRKVEEMENAEKRKKGEAEPDGEETLQPEKVKAAVAEVEKAKDRKVEEMEQGESPTKKSVRTEKDHQMSDGSTDEDMDTGASLPASPAKPPSTKAANRDVVKIRRQRSRGGWMRFSERDTAEYRQGYPRKKDSLNKKLNKLFYTNKIPSKPRGGYIDDILRDWYGDYDKLEQHHGYIQWLFPIREEGMNIESQDLQLHEAEAIKKDPVAHGRVLQAYEMMLHFYGMQLKNKKTGELERHENWKDRYRNLRSMRHNYLRITRILKALGELGYEHLKAPFLRFVLYEAMEERTLTPVLDSALDFWVYTIKDDAERKSLLDYASQYCEDV